MKKYALKDWLLRTTFFLGPTGIFFTPIPGIGSLRAFYFSTALINIYSLLKPSRKTLKQHTILSLISILFLTSASYSLINTTEDQPIYANPVIRTLVICNLMFGFYNISNWIISSPQKDIVQTLLTDSFKGFCVVFFLGFALYLGYINGKIPYNTYSLFTTLDQSAYGYSRFSPGTYPNEFGIICSFYAMYAMLVAQQRNNIIYLALGIAFTSGIFLTSTRAAYITLLLSYAYLAITAKNLSRKLLLTLLPVALIPIAIQILAYLSFDVLQVITTGYESATNNTGSSGVRMVDWNAAINDLTSNILLGVGLESPKAYSLHNLPLQIIYGLGAAGTFLLSIGGIVFYFINIKTTQNIQTLETTTLKTIKSTTFILFIHFAIFGLTNHNQAHFFTWMLFSLSCIKFKPRHALKNHHPPELNIPSESLE